MKRKRIITMALTFILVVSLAFTVSADTNTVQANITYRDIIVTLDGVKIDLKDANGNAVDPFIMNGTTYLPVRAVSEALGLEVAWVPETNAVALSTDKDIAFPDDNIYTIKDYTLVDNDIFTLKIVDMEEDDMGDLCLSLYAENKTKENDIIITTNYATINGYSFDAFFFMNVDAGKKTYGEMWLYMDDLKLNKINAADEVTFTLTASDANDYTISDYHNEDHTFYPTGKDADSIKYPARRTSKYEKVFIDNDKVTFIVLEYGEEDDAGRGLYCYMANKTDTPITFFWEDVSVNDYMIDPTWSDTINSHSCSYTFISFDETTLETCGISSFDKVDFTLNVSYVTGGESSTIVDKECTYYPFGHNSSDKENTPSVD